MDAELCKLEELLYGYNYAVFLRTFAAEHVCDADVATIAAAALGDEVEIRSTFTDSADKIVAKIKSHLEYRGDDSHGPIPERIESDEFSKLRDAVLNAVRELCCSSISVTGIWIGAGHPAYPVFWDFAYLFQGSESSIIFVGCSAD